MDLMIKRRGWLTQAKKYPSPYFHVDDAGDEKVGAVSSGIKTYFPGADPTTSRKH
ncbi:hypothetical protein [Pseudomonas sp. GL-B-19]|uniref:hypothetical protein n=1 Tax=Pseudomonas sp. GL-B-19 TaxID=2832393 RepID=UPI001CC0C203|nr:hypothetical protein [Pseudomonas sp. GL-B-19]